MQENEGDVLWNCLGLRRGAGEDKNYPPQCTVSAKFPTRLDYHILSTEKHVFIIGFTDYLFKLIYRVIPVPQKFKNTLKLDEFILFDNMDWADYVDVIMGWVLRSGKWGIVPKFHF